MSTHPNNIAEIRRKKKITQQQLADRLGVHVITVSKLERGVMQLTGSWLERLAQALETSQMELWGGFKLLSMDASGRLHDGENIEVVDPSENSFSAFRNPLGEPDAKWLHVQDNTLLPFFGEGDLVQFSLMGERELESAEYLDGRLCMYNVTGSQELHLGIIGKKHSVSEFDIRSMNGRLMKNVPINFMWYFSGYLSNSAIVAHFDTTKLGEKT
ncbi:helix-turn-helix domain-containing protein [Sinorhizobium meliloti]|uniref:helix-turn-helix domain-containing protein n=1 Tax=Rhizobium meliloti TaxID=382 RepID=UPI000518A4BB|nr:helix-turn-helix transcriptional regulator [Sinorhizobium meliloti]UDU21055.1 helix-turn-helix transcriptional regulator [Sinorhizobium meliloti]